MPTRSAAEPNVAEIAALISELRSRGNPFCALRRTSAPGIGTPLSRGNLSSSRKRTPRESLSQAACSASPQSVVSAFFGCLRQRSAMRWKHF